MHEDCKTPVIKISKSIFFCIPVMKTEDKFTFVDAYVTYLLFFYPPAPVLILHLCYVGKTDAEYYWSSCFCRLTHHLENTFLFCQPGPAHWKMYCSFACPAQPTGRAGPSTGFRSDPGSRRSLSYMHIFEHFFVHVYVLDENPSSSKHFPEF